MTRLLRGVARVLAWHAAGEPSARVGEQAAALTLYPDARRNVRRSPKSEARAAQTAEPLTARSACDARQHD